MSLTLQKEYPVGYSNDAVEVLETMAFLGNKSINLVGSMSLRSQVYAGDYDAYEKVVVHGTRESAVKDLVKRFKVILRNLQKLPSTYIGDIKSGSVEEWRILTTPYDAERSHQKLKELYDEKIITKKEYDDGLKRFKHNPTELEILLLERDFRPHIIRWKPIEVFRGYKMLSGRKFTLEEAFTSPTITKLDVMSWVQNNRFTDFSMIYEFKLNNTVLNPSVSDFETAINQNIFVLHHEKKFYKMAKRIFSYAKFKNNKDVLELLTPLFNGDLGRLYIVYGDIGTILDLFEYESHIPFSKLEIEFDQFKSRLSNISLAKYVHQEKNINHHIDELLVTTNKKHIISILEKLQASLLDLLSFYSEQYLKKHKLFPKY